MRRWAFAVMVFGMFVLLLMLNMKPKEIGSYEDMEQLEINTRVSVTGKVIEERVIYEDSKLLELENGIELVCECSGFFEDEEVEVIGVVSEYEGKKQIDVLEIIT